MPSAPRYLSIVSSFLLTGSLGVASVVQAAPRPAVVELFTSEGCNSCPPAEAYVGELAGRTDVLALAFHVDYWDALGWPDRFELSQATARQRKYGQVLRLRNVYTPQVILDGRSEFIGSDRSAIGQALNQSRDGVPVTLSVADGAIHVKVDSSQQGPRRRGDFSDLSAQGGLQHSPRRECRADAGGIQHRAVGEDARALGWLRARVLGFGVVIGAEGCDGCCCAGAGAQPGRNRGSGFAAAASRVIWPPRAVARRGGRSGDVRVINLSGVGRGIMPVSYTGRLTASRRSVRCIAGEVLE